MKKLFSIFLIMPALVAGSLMAKNEATHGNDELALKIGANAWPGYEFLYLAEQQGFFREQGLRASITQLKSSESARQAFERGQVNLMCGTAVEALEAFAHTGKKAPIILAMDYSDGADILIARKSISEVKDLKGKKVGVEPRSPGLILLAAALEEESMTLRDVDLFVSDYKTIRENFAAGKLDAIATYPAAAAAFEKAGEAVRLLSSADLPVKIMDTLSADASLLRARPDIVPAIRRAWGKALEFAQAHPEQAYEIMARRENIAPAQFKRILKDFHLLGRAEQESALGPFGDVENAIEATSRALSEAGFLGPYLGDPRDFIFTVPES